MNYTIKHGDTPEKIGKKNLNPVIVEKTQSVPDNTAVYNPAKDLQITNPKAETYTAKTALKSIPYESAQPD